MLKFLVMIVSGAIGFVVAFSLVTRNEIADEVEQKLDDDFTVQCMARLDVLNQGSVRKRDICNCMKAEFDTRGLSLSDALGSELGPMQDITRSCVALYE